MRPGLLHRLGHGKTKIGRGKKLLTIRADNFMGKNRTHVERDVLYFLL
jgi:hypothetical protein